MPVRKREISVCLLFHLFAFGLVWLDCVGCGCVHVMGLESEVTISWSVHLQYGNEKEAFICLFVGLFVFCWIWLSLIDLVSWYDAIWSVAKKLQC